MGPFKDNNIIITILKRVFTSDKVVSYMCVRVRACVRVYVYACMQGPVDAPMYVDCDVSISSLF